MTRRKTSRKLALGLTSAGAGVLGLTSIVTAPFALGDGEDLTLVSTGAEGIGTPANFVTQAYDLYVEPTHPEFAPTALDLPALDTPSINDPFGQATAELNTALTQTYAGDKIIDVTYSESTIAATQEMIALDAEQGQAGVPSPSDLSFILLGDLNNPNGGVFERLSGLNPGIDYYTATPSDTPYPTEIYTIQYDGAADFPQYPTDFAADLNALFGYATVHTEYGSLTSADLATAVLEPTTSADVATQYYMIPTQDLPLLEPIRDIPGIGPALADLMQPDLRVMVDMGYGDGPADVPTPASFSIPDYNYAAITSDLELGMQQGVTAAEVDLGILPASDLPDLYPYLPYVPGSTTVADPGLIETGTASTSSLDPLQALEGLGASGSDLTGLTTDLSGALSQLGTEFASFGFDPTMLTSLFGL